MPKFVITAPRFIHGTYIDASPRNPQTIELPEIEGNYADDTTLRPLDENGNALQPMKLAVPATNRHNVGPTLSEPNEPYVGQVQYTGPVARNPAVVGTDANATPVSAVAPAAQAAADDDGSGQPAQSDTVSPDTSAGYTKRRK